MRIGLADGSLVDVRCTLCGESGLSRVGLVQGAPAVLGVSPQEPWEEDRFTDFSVLVCSVCGGLQTNAHLDLSVYGVIHSHAIGRVWVEHARRLAAFVRRALSGAAVGSVLEVGPSVSPLSRQCCGDAVRIVYVDMMDAAPFKLMPNESYCRGPFPCSGIGGLFDVVVASHVLEHAGDLQAFVRGVQERLSPSGTAVLSTPNFRVWLEQCFWNAITSEHVNYPFEDQLYQLCETYGLSPTIGYFEQHSVFVAARKRQESAVTSLGWTWDPSPGDAFREWVRGINEGISRFEEAVRGRELEVLLAGASHLAQYLYLCSGAVREHAVAVVDNARSKHGSRLYGTPLKVEPFDVVRGYTEVMVLVPPSPYASEMRTQVLALNPHAVVVV